MRKNRRCTVCGAKLILDKNLLYQSSEQQGVFSTLANPNRIYDCVDCPVCGCQAPLKIRMPEVIKDDIPEMFGHLQDKEVEDESI